MSSVPDLSTSTARVTTETEEFAERSSPLADIPRLALVDQAAPHQSHIVEPISAEPDSSAETFSLVDQAANTIILLLERNRILTERELDVVASVKGELEQMQQRLDAANRRAEMAEQSLHHERSKRSGMEERIKAAFGIGSGAHRGIQAAAELNNAEVTVLLTSPDA